MKDSLKMKNSLKDALIEIGLIYSTGLDLIYSTGLDLRPLSQIIDSDLLKVGSMICYSPNAGYDCEYKIRRTANTVGVRYQSDGLISAEYFSIFTENNKPDNIGHIEIGWYESAKIDRRKKLYRRGGDAAAIVYLLANRYDIFGLLNSKP